MKKIKFQKHPTTNNVRRQLNTKQSPADLICGFFTASLIIKMLCLPRNVITISKTERLKEIALPVDASPFSY